MQKQNFKKALSVLKDMKIVLFLSDHQFVEGILLDVKKDHLVVDVDQNVFYIALEHIQGLSKNSKGLRILPKKVPYLNIDTLADVLMVMQYNWVSVNSLGKQAYFGMLSKVSEDYIILIDNMEQLYIRKSYISNIYKGQYEERNAHIHKEPAIEESSSHINVETNEHLDTTEDEEIEHDQHNEEVIVKQIEATDKNESEKSVEVSIKTKLTEVETEITVNVINEHLEIHPINEIIKETSLLQLDTQDLADKTEDNERQEGPKQESIIRDIASRMNDGSKEQLNSSLDEELEHDQHNEKVIVKQIETTDEIESEKSVEVPINMKLTEVETDSVNVTNEHPETHPMNETIKETGLLQLDTLDLAEKIEDNERNEEPSQERIIQDIAPRINDESKEQLDSSAEEEEEEEIQVNQHEERVRIKHIQSKNIKETKEHIENRIISDEQYTHIIPRVRRKKKRRLKTTCCTIKNIQHAISQKELDRAIEFPVHEEDSYKVARRSKRMKSLSHPTGDNTSNNKLKSDENFDVLVEKTKPVETYTSPLSLRQNPKEEKAILERQYYALMKHASKKYVEMQHCPDCFMPLEIFYLPVRKEIHNEKATIKKQYYSLMKHAEKMYCQLKDERLKNEI
ncbi:DUF2642 domain-containing protein [Sporosarcina sp. Marseille-Q4063]|uniref:DUF2642 domain-containing protein n=1 Tax=Sporosarcina sp. Marseille-Q4063 TaxID=2810514 RepID=UPI001BB08F92|nr:DUF2642 domain-containing protein [Sporosarcina sp. Marseille-Q4063]QUW23671.1 DUF2642 domain-containing protein [Sporosarcina sp. Marseille-Q4063]